MLRGPLHALKCIMGTKFLLKVIQMLFSLLSAQDKQLHAPSERTQPHRCHCPCPFFPVINLYWRAAEAVLALKVLASSVAISIY